MNLAICFLSTIKDHFNLKILKEQCQTSKFHNIDIFEYINDDHVDYKKINNTIYFCYEYLKNKFNYHHSWFNKISPTKTKAGLQFLPLLDMYINNQNKYDIYLFYEDDLSYFGDNNLFDKIDFNCDIIFQDLRIDINTDNWYWWYKNNNHIINSNLKLYHGLLNIYGLKYYIFDDLVNFIHNNYLHHEGLISIFALNNHYKINYINNYITTYLDWYDSYNDYNIKYELIHPIKTYEKYKQIKEIYERI